VTGEWIAAEDHPRDLQKYRISGYRADAVDDGELFLMRVRGAFCFAIETSMAMVSKEPLRVSNQRDIGKISKWQ
jgi:hypothetical protein